MPPRKLADPFHSNINDGKSNIIELKPFGQKNTPRPIPGESYAKQTLRGLGYGVGQKVEFTIFIVLSVTAILFLIPISFNTICYLININLLGKFKREPIAKPELYYDVACINSQKYEDFKMPNQTEICRKLHNIDRPGPPFKF